MKLIVNLNDIIDTFAQKTGLDPNQIEIDTNSIIGFQPLKGSITDPAVRDAIITIFNDTTRLGYVDNRIALIKAVRTLTSAGIKDSKDFVENVLVR